MKRRTETPVFEVKQDVLQQIINTIGSLPAESGGAVGGHEESTLISNFVFDEKSETSAVTYSPDTNFLNGLFEKEWNPCSIRLRGFIHSHPGRMNRPSYGDEVYAERILKAIPDLEGLWLPIINTIPESGEFHLTPWITYPRRQGVKTVRAKVRITRDENDPDLEVNGVTIPADVLRPGTLLDSIIICPEKYRRHIDAGQDKSDTKVSVSLDQTFDRVQDAYDLDLMHSTRIIAVGAGGAADWLENLARAGVGQFILIDPDVVSETNLATQQVYRKDIGRAKVDCIAERIKDINPAAKVFTLAKFLDDLDDGEIKGLAFDDFYGQRAQKTIICGLTDSFWAQARVNRIALNLGLPSLCAQVYQAGRGAEITFTYPGVTPACHRCILSSRYKYFLQDRQENDVTSHGTPIFATTRLNALKGYITLAMIHHGSDHPRWGKFLSRVGNRNLVQLRADPDIEKSIGLSVFDRVFAHADRERLFFDETVWLPQEPENPDNGCDHCPDCGGSGHLDDARGTIEDTCLSAHGHTVATIEA